MCQTPKIDTGELATQSCDCAYYICGPGPNLVIVAPECLIIFSFRKDKETDIIQEVKPVKQNVDLISMFVGTCPGEIFRSMMFYG